MYWIRYHGYIGGRRTFHISAINMRNTDTKIILYQLITYLKNFRT
jgi:hypothetical protein